MLSLPEITQNSSIFITLKRVYMKKKEFAFQIIFVSCLIILFSCNEEDNPNPVTEEKWDYYNTQNGLISNEVYSVEVHENSIWFGTEYGVSTYEGTSWKSYNTSHGLIYHSVHTIAFDQTIIFGLELLRRLSL